MSESRKRRRFCLEQSYYYYRLWKRSEDKKHKSLLINELRGFMFAIMVKYIDNADDRKDFCQEAIIRIIGKLQCSIESYDIFKSWFYSLVKNDKDIYFRAEDKKHRLSDSDIKKLNYIKYFSNPSLEYEGKDLERLINIFSSKLSPQNQVIFKHMRKGYKGKSLAKVVNEELKTVKFTGDSIAKYANKLRQKFRSFLDDLNKL
ncbi:hypothetical protein ACE193_25320 (plasmid) [Bernardetia sp. OM2101]|uniref:hypothetical protein n=1 Tax=Bernardetia sp. OM2101 TaxID=3344876 RepID=UPI0035CFD7F6